MAGVVARRAEQPASTNNLSEWFASGSGPPPCLSASRDGRVGVVGLAFFKWGRTGEFGGGWRGVVGPMCRVHWSAARASSSSSTRPARILGGEVRGERAPRRARAAMLLFRRRRRARCHRRREVARTRFRTTVLTPRDLRAPPFLANHRATRQLIIC